MIARYPVLNENWQFRRAYQRGRSQADALLVTYVVKNKLPCTRVGLTASKKIGKAVMRNRARRVMKAALFPLEGKIKSGYDIVFVARAKTPYAKSSQVQLVMEKQLQKAGLLQEATAK